MIIYILVYTLINVDENSFQILYEYLYEWRNTSLQMTIYYTCLNLLYFVKCASSFLTLFNYFKLCISIFSFHKQKTLKGFLQEIKPRGRIFIILVCNPAKTRSFVVFGLWHDFLCINRGMQTIVQNNLSKIFRNSTLLSIRIVEFNRLFCLCSHLIILYYSFFIYK